ncbi:MAG: site-2 protease family protein, partial [Flavobacteriaceae bacterium]|nr:site-2 protease family protein [Flavobacteriaceae bacterium]
MSPFVVKAIQLLMSLSLLIILHELGHFIPARIFKTRVEKFFLFFDVKFALFKKKIGETNYGIGWLPLGGYVKISGMIDESMDTEQMKQPAQPWEFRSKPAWQRLIIMLGGVTVNLLLGFLIYIMILFVWGKNTLYTDALPLGLEPSPIAQQIGFKTGDKLITVDGKKLDNVLEINKLLFLRSVESVTVKHSNGKTEKLSIPENFGNRMFESGEL